MALHRWGKSQIVVNLPVPHHGGQGGRVVLQERSQSSTRTLYRTQNIQTNFVVEVCKQWQEKQAFITNQVPSFICAPTHLPVRRSPSIYPNPFESHGCVHSRSTEKPTAALVCLTTTRQPPQHPCNHNSSFFGNFCYFSFNKSCLYQNIYSKVGKLQTNLSSEIPPRWYESKRSRHFSWEFYKQIKNIHYSNIEVLVLVRTLFTSILLWVQKRIFNGIMKAGTHTFKQPRSCSFSRCISH